MNGEGKDKTTLHNTVNGEDKDTRSNLKPPDIVETITKVLGAIVGVASLIYVVGFTIVNLYLSTYSVRVFTLNRATYLAAGTIFLLLFFLVSSWGFLIVDFFVDWIEKKRPWHKGITTPVAILLLLLLFLEFLFSSLKSDIIRVLIYMIGLGVIINLWRRNKLEPITKMDTKGKGLVLYLVIFALMYFIPRWAWDIHPNIRSEFGGGSPAKVRLVISDIQKKDIFTQSGIEINDNEIVTSEVDLLDDTGENLILLPKNKQAVQMDRSLIASIIYLTPTPTVDTATPAPGTIITATPTITPTLSITPTATLTQP